MIRINDDWVIEADGSESSKCYLLKKDMHKDIVDGDTGKKAKSMKIVGYYTKIENAVSDVAERVFMEKVQSGDMGLKTACDEFRQIRNDIENIVKGNTNDHSVDPGPH